jgi:hypothetical protein
MTRKSIKGIYAHAMSAKAGPVEENKNLPAMDAVDIKKPTQPPLKKGAMLMDNVKATVVTKKAMDTGKAMRPFAAVKVLKAEQKELPPQISKATRKPADAYVVFRMHVQNGVMSVVGSKRVQGSLVQHEDIVQGGLTYEVTLNKGRLSIGAVADFGEQRSFARQGGEAGEHVHHITILPSFDFNVKIPGNKIALKDLPKLQISLYKFKEQVPDLKLSLVPLHTQFEKEVREVATLKGIKIASLGKDVKELVKKAIGK